MQAVAVEQHRQAWYKLAARCERLDLGSGANSDTGTKSVLCFGAARRGPLEEYCLDSLQLGGLSWRLLPCRCWLDLDQTCESGRI